MNILPDFFFRIRSKRLAIFLNPNFPAHLGIIYGIISNRQVLVKNLLADLNSRRLAFSQCDWQHALAGGQLFIQGCKPLYCLIEQKALETALASLLVTKRPEVLFASQVNRVGIESRGDENALADFLLVNDLQGIACLGHRDLPFLGAKVKVPVGNYR